MNRSKIIMATVCLYLGGIIGGHAATVVYDGKSLGNGTGNARIQMPLSKAKWFASYGPAATESEVINWAEGFVQGHVALVTAADIPSNPYYGNEVLLWTDDLKVPVDFGNLFEIRFIQNNGNADHVIPRVALRVNRQWYVSEETFEHVSPIEKTSLPAEKLAKMKWHLLMFEPGTIMKKKPKAISFETLAGPVDAIGFFYDKLSGRARIRALLVTAK